MRKSRILAATIFTLIIPSCAFAGSYRGNSYICKSFNTVQGHVTASVSYAKNTSLRKDTVECKANTSGTIGIYAACSYNEKVYHRAVLTNSDHLDSSKAKKQVDSLYSYGKLSLTGDTTQTLYADE